VSIYDKYRREIDRKSHELLHSHGINAHKYADKLAAEALAEGETEESEFWKAVADSIRPRAISN
jgi:ABC-type antimicrobial peptide transport system ATPase subunit